MLMITLIPAKGAPGKIDLRAPYNTVVVAKLRALGGKWIGDAGVWRVDARYEGAVRALCARYYGTDGLGLPDTVDVRILQPHGSRTERLGEGGHPTDWGDGFHLNLYGRPLVNPHRHPPLAEGVVLRKGNIKAQPHRQVEWSPYTIEVLDVPRVLAAEMAADHPNCLEIIDRPNPHTPAGRMARRAVLEQQIAMLDRAMTSALAELVELNA